MNTANTSQTARVSRPHRTQIEVQLLSLEQMLPPDHRSRDVWAFVNSLDLESFYRDIEVTDGSPGRPAIASEILIALWLLTTLDGIGSARELDRRCETDIAYLWVLGTVRVNYHTLSDFRVKYGKHLERLLVNTVAALIEGQNPRAIQQNSVSGVGRFGLRNPGVPHPGRSRRSWQAMR